MLLTTMPRICDQAEVALHCSFWLRRISTSNTLSSFVLSLSLSRLSREREQREIAALARAHAECYYAYYYTLHGTYVVDSEL